MSTPIFLTNDEISHLTARKNKGAQIDALRRMGLPFFVNATGHPVVTRAAIEGGFKARQEAANVWTPQVLKTA
ncbi:hypothetical protein CAGGBEG34_610002 [Candidatus Glomeribacter gigasporarum BEG34]|uniref:DUF4224 domain-containing protein n=1 Tax=Candidatus Glomeribacter gigasporarum BEG34 TaxID=1070319 RepID=G2JBT3_9BURK|nr:DUF4224 domain-containing protein [Candidatus Glomeribacter gigasporarum]CCD30238.1 hypothetical protein CAGGBEG34_610002 [Candidatus Glomeribacter gigasporarum BEG34]